MFQQALDQAQAEEAEEEALQQAADAAASYVLDGEPAVGEEAEAYYKQLEEQYTRSRSYVRDTSMDSVKFWDENWFNFERMRYPDPLPEAQGRSWPGAPGVGGTMTRSSGGGGRVSHRFAPTLPQHLEAGESRLDLEEEEEGYQAPGYPFVLADSPAVPPEEQEEEAQPHLQAEVEDLAAQTLGPEGDAPFLDYSGAGMEEGLVDGPALDQGMPVASAPQATQSMASATPSQSGPSAPTGAGGPPSPPRRGSGGRVVTSFEDPVPVPAFSSASASAQRSRVGSVSVVPTSTGSARASRVSTSSLPLPTSPAGAGAGASGSSVAGSHRPSRASLAPGPRPSVVGRQRSPSSPAPLPEELSHEQGEVARSGPPSMTVRPSITYPPSPGSSARSRAASIAGARALVDATTVPAAPSGARRNTTLASPQLSGRLISLEPQPSEPILRRTRSLAQGAQRARSRSPSSAPSPSPSLASISAQHSPSRSGSVSLGSRAPPSPLRATTLAPGSRATPSSSPSPSRHASMVAPGSNSQPSFTRAPSMAAGTPLYLRSPTRGNSVQSIIHTQAPRAGPGPSARVAAGGGASPSVHGFRVSLVEGTGRTGSVPPSVRGSVLDFAGAGPGLSAPSESVRGSRTSLGAVGDRRPSTQQPRQQGTTPISQPLQLQQQQQHHRQSLRDLSDERPPPIPSAPQPGRQPSLVPGSSAESARKLAVEEDLSFRQDVMLGDPRYDLSVLQEDPELGNTSLPLNGMKNVLAALQEHSNTISSLQSTLDLSKSAAAALQASKSVQLPSTTDPLSKLNALHNTISAESMLRAQSTPGMDIQALIERKVFEQLQSIQGSAAGAAGHEGVGSPARQLSPEPSGMREEGGMSAPASPRGPRGTSPDGQQRGWDAGPAGNMSVDRTSNFNTLDASFLESLASPRREAADEMENVEPPAAARAQRSSAGPTAATQAFTGARNLDPAMLGEIQARLSELETSLLASGRSLSGPIGAGGSAPLEANGSAPTPPQRQQQASQRPSVASGASGHPREAPLPQERAPSVIVPPDGEPSAGAQTSAARPVPSLVEDARERLYPSYTAMEERLHVVERQMERLAQLMLNLQETNSLQAKRLAETALTEQQVGAMIRTALQQELKPIKAALRHKVDSSVLEELVRHIPTRPEVSKLVKHKLKETEALRERVEKGFDEILLKLERLALVAGPEAATMTPGAMTPLEMKRVKELVDQAAAETRDFVLNDVDLRLVRLKREFSSTSPSKPATRTPLSPVRGGMAGAVGGSAGENQDPMAAAHLLESMKKELKVWVGRRLGGVMQENTTWMNERVEVLRDELNAAFVKEIKKLQKPPTDSAELAEQDLELLSKELSRRFDEKLFLLSSELSLAKTAFHRASSSPFFKMGQWLWKSGALKLGSAVPWNLQAHNTDEDNFLWEQDTANLRVAEPGLYEITFAFFTKAKPSIQLVVNGESVLSAINSPSYIVHHSSGFVTDGTGRMEEGTVTGISLVDFLALPPKSTLSVHYHGGKKGALGHGFLGLRRL